MIRQSALFVLISCSVALAGCGGQGISAPNTAPVQGTVLFMGEPAEGVRVTFHAQFDMGSVKFMPSGLTGADGKFTLSTAKPGDGAPPGEYVVTFDMPQIESDPDNGLEIEVDAWSGRHSNLAASKWKVQIRDGDNALEVFRLN